MLRVDLERRELAGRVRHGVVPEEIAAGDACGTSSPEPRQTTTCSTDGDSVSASSTSAFIGTSAPRRSEPSAVTTTFASACRSLAAIAGAAKPEKTGT